MRTATNVTAGVLLGIAALTFGCSEVAMSPREMPGASFADAVRAVGESASAGRPAYESGSYAGTVTIERPVRFAGPIRLSVSQLGEVAPPQSMLERFRKRPDLFAAVEPIAIGLKDGKANVDVSALNAARLQAGQMGLQYILICGGTIDTNGSPTPLTALNFTIIGAFVVPSVQLSADGRAAGLVIDVESGRPVFTVSAESSAGTFQPSFMSRDAGDRLTDAVRSKLADGLTTAIIERMASR